MVMNSSASNDTLSAEGLRFGIVCSRFNKEIVQNMHEAAVEKLKEKGAEEIVTKWVPGAYEIPVIAQAFAKSGEFDALITLGCVIRGDTRHFEMVADQASAGVMRVALDNEIPVIMGILAPNNIEDAKKRSGFTGPNSGTEYALTAIEMAQFRLNSQERCGSKS